MSNNNNIEVPPILNACISGKIYKSSVGRPMAVNQYIYDITAYRKKNKSKSSKEYGRK